MRHDDSVLCRRGVHRGRSFAAVAVSAVLLAGCNAPKYFDGYAVSLAAPHRMCMSVKGGVPPRICGTLPTSVAALHIGDCIKTRWSPDRAGSTEGRFTQLSRPRCLGVD